MPHSVRKSLDRLHHPKSKIPQYDPHRWSVPAYGIIIQMAQYTDESNILIKKATNRIQSIVGTILYYEWSVVPTILLSINKILQVQLRPTWDTEEKARILLYYAAIYSNAIRRYKACDMFLHVDSEAAYLNMPEARSCYAGHFYLSSCPSPSPIKPNPKTNGPIHTECKTIHNIVSFAA